MKLRVSILSDEEILRIDSSSLQILERTGIKVMSDEAIAVFKRAGAIINDRTGIVRIPEDVIREALDSAPKKITLFARNPDNDIDLFGIDVPGLTTDGTAMQMLDYGNNAYRRGTTRDLFRLAIVSDYLAEIDVFWPMIVASDVSDAEHTIHEFSTSLIGTSKHIQHEAHGALEANAEVEIARAIAGGKEELRKRPIFSCVFTPVSPLAFEKGSTEAMIVLAKAGIPVVSMSIVQSGYTGPNTLAGTLTMANSEILASLVLVQNLSKKLPFIYGIFSAPFDFSSSSFLAGSPELALVSSAGAQMAEYYGLPSLASGMITDAKLPCDQAAFEKTQTGLLPALAGASLISGIGGINTDATVSLEQLVIDCEIWASIERILRGIRVDPEFIGLELIDRLGPMGEYLMEFNGKKMTKEDIHQTRLPLRMDYGEWKLKGAKSLEDSAHEIVKRILSTHHTAPLEKSVEKEVIQISKEFRKNVTHHEAG